MLRKNGVFVYSLLIGLVAAPAAAQLRVANWNVTNYSTGRVAAFQSAIYGSFEGRSMAPDIFIGQEFLSASSVNNFLIILNNAPGSPGDWAAAPFSDGNDTDNAFFYRTSKVQFLGMTVVAVGGFPPNHPRDVNRYDVRPVGYDGASATIACYSTHMKAGSSGEDQTRRLLEAQRIRDNAELLPAEWNFLLAGDFNIQDSNQAAYLELTGIAGNNDGRLFDPIRRPGAWNNSSAFRFIHTQDPSGAGGMDDRHDQILLSEGLIDADAMDYLGDQTVPYSATSWDDPNHSYRVWGNDGTSFNSAIEIANNQMVGPVIAQALFNSAPSGGHLPVFLDVLVPPMIDSETILDFGSLEVDKPAALALHVSNPGDIALWSTDGIAPLRYTMTSTDPTFLVPVGEYAAFAGDPANTHFILMDTSVEGKFSATIEIASNTSEEPMRLVTVTGVVGGAGLLLGDTNCDGVISVSDIAPFVLALTDPAGYALTFPSCDILHADVNGDKLVGVGDIGPFVAVLTNP